MIPRFLRSEFIPYASVAVIPAGTVPVTRESIRLAKAERDAQRRAIERETGWRIREDGTIEYPAAEGR